MGEKYTKLPKNTKNVLSFRYSALLKMIFASALHLSSNSSHAGDINNADWGVVNPYGFLSTDGVTRDMTCGNGKLYIVGTFNYAGNCAAKNIASWDGHSWSGIGNGVKEYPTAIKVDRKENIYLTVRSDTTGQSPYTHILQWSGTGWHRLGSTEWFIIYDFVLDSIGTPYIAGDIIQKDGSSSFAFCRWNGVSWVTAPSYFTDSHGVNVKSICMDSATLFQTDGGSGAIYQYNGESWGVYIGGVRGKLTGFGGDSAGNIYKCITSSSKIAGEDVMSFLITCWSSITNEWKQITEWTVGRINEFNVDNDGTLFVSGQFKMINSIVCNNIAMWDGAHWIGLGKDKGTHQLYDQINHLTYDGNGTLYIEGGMRADSSTDLIQGIFKWNKGVWKPVGPGINGSVSAIAYDYRGRIFVGGSFTTFDNLFVKHVMQWDGINWTGLGTGLDNIVYSDPVVYDMTFDNDNNLVIGGSFTVAGTKSSPYIAKWNGNEWSKLGEGLDKVETVVSICKDGLGNLYAAAGRKLDGSSAYGPSISYCNGTQWIKIGEVPYESSGCISKMVCKKNNDLYAIGSFFEINTIGLKQIAKWNGIFWDSVPRPNDSGFNFTPINIALDMQDRLYVAGVVKSITEQSKSLNYHVYRLEDKHWVGLGSTGFRCSNTFFEKIKTFAFDSRGNLYVGGEFDTVDGIAAKNIAKWDGTRWSSLGSGTDNIVSILAIVDSIMYVGGIFNKAGDIFSPRIAKVNLNGSGNRIKPGNRAHGIIVSVKFKVIKSKLMVYGAKAQDIVNLFSISGRCIYSGSVGMPIELNHLAKQPFVISILRQGKPVSTDMVMVQ